MRPVEQEWIERSMDWLRAQFGDERLRGAVVRPTDDFFPGVYRGSRDDIRTVLGRLCAHMGVDALARYAWLRGEPKPPWAAHLDTNPRTFLKRGLRFLEVSGR